MMMMMTALAPPFRLDRRRDARLLAVATKDALVDTKVGAQAEASGQDGSPNGIGWGWVFLGDDNNIAYRLSLTRGRETFDKYMAGFSGILTSDKYAVYAAALDPSRQQSCWAHEIRNAEEDSIRPDAGCDSRRLLGDLRLLFHSSKRLLEWLPPSRRLRSSAEADMYDLIDRYRESKNAATRRMVARLESSLPTLFTFMEHEGVDPTNDAPERAIRFLIRFRKMCGQLKGGRRSMRRLGHFATCVMTWWA